jgi:hypothetical protein
MEAARVAWTRHRWSKAGVEAFGPHDAGTAGGPDGRLMKKRCWGQKNDRLPASRGGSPMNDIPDLLDGLRRSPQILSCFVGSVPADRLDLRRRDPSWTIAEHVSHLAQVQFMLLERLQRFRDEVRPVFVPYIPGEGAEEPDTPQVMAMAEALERFARCRNRQVELLSEADPTLWEKTGDHPEYTRYSLYILARHILMHDHWHMYRMEELWLTRDAYLTSVA